MSAICSATNGANFVSLEDSGEKWKFLKNDFLPQNDVFFFCVCFFFSGYLKFSIFSQNNDLPQFNLANSTFLGVKDTKIWPQKEVNPLRG